CTGRDLVLTVKRDLDDPDASCIFQHEDSAGLEVIDEESVSWTVVAPNTNNLTESELLYFDLKANLNNGPVVVARGRLRVKLNVTIENTSSVPIETVSPGSSPNYVS